MKKIVSLILSLSIFLCVGQSVSAAEVSTVQNNVDTASVVLDANSKIIFANKMDAIYAEALAAGEIKPGNRSEIDKLMEAATFATTETELEKVRHELSQYGTYMYDSPVTAHSRSFSGDVTLATPIIFYESWERTWTVTCGGNWKNGNWWEQLWTAGVGNVGGVDAFGVGYTNSTHTYKSSVVRASAYITDSIDELMETTSNRSDGDGSKGFGFRFQDYSYTWPDGVGYVGYKWYGSCTYDANFSSYNGVATAYYFHTYSRAEISSISFGVEGKTAGVNVNITEQQYSFPAYSSDRTFGVY